MGKFPNLFAEALWGRGLQGFADGDAVLNGQPFYFFHVMRSGGGLVLWEDSQGFVYCVDCSPHEWDEMLAEEAKLQEGYY